MCDKDGSVWPTLEKLMLQIVVIAATTLCSMFMILFGLFFEKLLEEEKTNKARWLAHKSSEFVASSDVSSSQPHFDHLRLESNKGRKKTNLFEPIL